MKRHCSVLMIIASVILSGCTIPDSEQVRQRQHLPGINFIPEIKKGNVLFHKQCAGCHGQAGSGTNTGPPLIHNIYRPGHHADMAFNWAVKNGVKQHHWHFGDMPAMANVSPEQVGHITAYIRHQQRKNQIR